MAGYRAAIRRYGLSADPAALDDAIERLDEVLARLPAGHRQRLPMLFNLSVCLQVRYSTTAALADLQRSVSLADQVVAQSGASEHLHHAGAVHRLRSEALDSADDLAAALRLAQAAVEAAPDRAERAHALSSLGFAHRLRFGRTGDSADLEAAIRFGTDAVRTSPPEDVDERATYLQNVGIAFGERFEISGDPGDLDANTWHAAEALRLTPAGSPDRLPRMLNLGMAQLRRYRRLGDPADLERSIDSLADAARQVPEGDAEHATYLTNLAIAYTERFGRTGAIGDLDLARGNEERALALTPVGHVDRPARLSNLAGTHLERYWRFGDPADLDAALNGSAEAVRASPPDTPALRHRLRNLGYAYRARYDLTGVVSDIDAAVRCGLDALALCPPDATDRPFLLSAVGFAYLARSIPLGADGEDLDTGLHHVAEASRVTPDTDPEYAVRLADLGSAHRFRFTRRGDPADLDAAIRLGAEALAALPDGHPRRAMLLGLQGDAHYERFQLNGPGRHADAVAMVDLATEALRHIPIGHADRPHIMADLGEVYRVRDGATGDPADRDRAVQLLSDAVADIAPDDPRRAARLIGLARAHLNRGPGDRPKALRLLQEAAAVPTALPTRRIEAARLWGDVGVMNGDASAAAAGYATAVGLLPLLAWRGLARAERQSRLAATAGLTSLATAWAINAGRLETAVEVLEQGRAVLWAQSLQTRADLTGLRATRPDLADRLTALRHRIDDHGLPGTAPLDEPERSAADHRRDAEAWEATVEQVRALDGFDRFLRPTPFADLRAAAAGGPVVLVNVSPVRCDALVVTATAGVRLVPLPDLDERECARRAAALSHSIGGPARDARLRRPAPALFGLLGWLWDTVCTPVLADLGPRPARSRLWWSLTGPLAALPVHAAGRYGAGGRALPDVAVSSYTPTLGALLRARSGAVPARSEVLAVGMPTTPPVDGRNLGDLPGVVVELDRLAARLPCRQLRTQTRPEQAAAAAVPADRQPTVARVLSALPSYAWVHLACHGGQDPDDPSSGALQLADGPLTVLRIAALDLHAAELAFLSACSTAVGGTDLHDEAIHLAAAMQVAGYRHVLATAWSISDEHTPDLVDQAYAAMVPDAARAAEALHAAVAALRTRLPDRPDLWAAYLHVGP